MNHRPLGTPNRRQHYNHFLFPKAQRDRVEIVPVSPRNPLNIGAAARA
jgi:hypothetical protein